MHFVESGKYLFLFFIRNMSFCFWLYIVIMPRSALIFQNLLSSSIFHLMVV